MKLTLKRCSNISLLDGISQFCLNGKAILSIIERDIRDKSYLAALGLAYLLVVDKGGEDEQSLRRLINWSNIGRKKWEFTPQEFNSGLSNETVTLLKYALMHSLDTMTLRMFIEAHNFRYFQSILVQCPLPLQRFKNILPNFDINRQFDDDSFHFCDPRLLLHYYLDRPDIVHFLIKERKADVKKVNAIGFDFTTYAISKQKYSLALTYDTTSADLINACKEMNSWNSFLEVKRILQQKGYTLHHPIIPLLLNILYRKRTVDRKILLDPLLHYIQNSRSINYIAITLLRNIISDNDPTDKQKGEIQRISKTLQLHNIRLATHPICSKKI